MTDRPLGPLLSGWTPPPPPPRAVLEGRTVRVEPLDAARHGADLWASAGQADLWDYMAYGPFPDEATYRAWLEAAQGGQDPLYVAFCATDRGRALGVASWLRITPAHGTIELGNIALSPALQGTTAATEALHLMIASAFAAGYRRCEWKCDALNAPSRRAALRLGFRFEGVFRHHMVIKGRNRDTAWFAITEDDWPALAAAHRHWLAPGNFDADGRQRSRLAELTAAATR